ncbi:MAG TPA: calcium/sodium antiporter [Longimicrobiales bacterium]|nr:calcium/sodium antiporter [Longimicrobiales bacterium]
MTAVLLVLGVAALVAGAELLVRGAARIAARFGISSLVIGLTVVAFGTSSPELAVSAAAALRDEADIALGNVIGSNIFNILVVLGLSALVAPIVVAREVIREQTPIMIGVSVLMLLFALNGVIGRVEGVLLFLGILVYTTALVVRSRRESLASQTAEPMLATGPDQDEAEAIERGEQPRLLRPLIEACLGLALLVLGSNLLVQGATGIAAALGVSELVVGLTIVAAGTSLPEVATSIVAAIRGERDMAVGNIVGSNIFNTLAILGAAAMLAPDGIGVPPAALSFDLPVMIAVALVCLPIFFNGQVIQRWEGMLLVGFYIAYTVYLALDASEHDAFTEYRAAMLYFVLPLALLTLLASSVRTGRRVVVERRGQSRP